MKIEDSRKVWVAWTNTDLTEGRGAEYPKAVCEEKATAIRLGKGGSVQGSSCKTTEEIAVRINGKWLVPGRILRPTREDKMLQEKIDAKTKAIEKAQAAGLTEEDIKALSNEQ